MSEFDFANDDGDTHCLSESESELTAHRCYNLPERTSENPASRSLT